MAAFLLAASHRIHAQAGASPADAAISTSPAAAHQPPAQDLVVESMVSYGNYRIFAGGSNSRLYTGGVEYDRNSWGTWLKARRDFAGEVLPVMVLDEPSNTDIFGDKLGPGRKVLYGIGIDPVGMRLVWHESGFIKPYFSVKGGVLVFDGKVLSKVGTYEQFSLQEAAGLMLRMSPSYDLRLGLLGDFHFSNGFMVDVNPGLDVMNCNIGLVYHMGSRKHAPTGE